MATVTRYGHTYTIPDPGPGKLSQILDERFVPEYERLQGRQSELENLLLERLRTPTDFGQFRGELSATAESLANELFGAGGAVEKAYSDAFGKTVESGFGTTSGGFDRARQNILGQARDTVANTIAQNAINLAPVAAQSRATDIASLLDFTNTQGAMLGDIRDSLFTGQASIEQLRLGREQMDLNRRLIEESLRRGSGGGGIGGFLKGIGQAGIGFALGGAGAAVSTGVEDWVSKLF